MSDLRPRTTEQRIRILRHSRTPRRGVRLKAACFFGLLLALMVFSLLLPLRPADSERERRELTKFPEFSVEALQSGRFFRGIETWFSDTFPGRDSFLDVNKQITSLYGIRTVEVRGELPQGDDIPDKPFTGK